MLTYNCNKSPECVKRSEKHRTQYCPKSNMFQAKRINFSGEGDIVNW